MEEILQIIETMRKQFGWDKSDTTEFLIGALEGEVNELKAAINNPDDFQKELADVLMYAIALAMKHQLNIKTIIENKANEVMKREY